MITVKAFDKNLRCRGFQYEINKEYKIPTNEVEICERGFHTSAHCDISETLNYYPDIFKTRYCLVDINVVEESGDKVVGDKIKIIKELNPDECIKYDKTGEWTFKYILKLIETQQNISIIEKYLFLYINNIRNYKNYERLVILLEKIQKKYSDLKKILNFQLLEENILKIIKKINTKCDNFLITLLELGFGVKKIIPIKSKFNEDCLEFLTRHFFKDKIIENIIIKNDKNGKYCHNLLINENFLNIKKIIKTIIEKDKNGMISFFTIELILKRKYDKKYNINEKIILNLFKNVVKSRERFLSFYFIRDLFKEKDKNFFKKLKNIIINYDNEYGFYHYDFVRCFYKMISPNDIKDLENSIIKKYRNYCCWDLFYTLPIHYSKFKEFIDVVTKYDETGENLYLLFFPHNDCRYYIFYKLKKKFSINNKYFKKIKKEIGVKFR